MGIAIIDPVTGRCLIESGVDGCEAGVLPTLANALYGPMDGFSRNPVNVRSLVAITARYLSTTSTTSHLWDSSAGGGAAHSIIADTSQKPGSTGGSGASTVSMVAAQASAANSSMSTGCTDREEISGMWDL